MSAITFPAEFGLPLDKGYSKKFDQRFSRTEVENRDPEINGRFNWTGASRINVAWTFTRNEMELFRDFYDGVLSFGAKSFNITLFTENGYEMVVARFVGPFKAQLGWNWEVNAVLAIEKYP